jgi:hypothetical protein
MGIPPRPQACTRARPPPSNMPYSELWCSSASSYHTLRMGAMAYRFLGKSLAVLAAVVGACLAAPHPARAAATHLGCPGSLLLLNGVNWPIYPPVQVVVMDDLGLSTDTTTITAQLLPAGNAGTLAGSLQAVTHVQSFAGGVTGSVATFPNLIINGQGSGYQLQFTAPGLQSCTTGAFTVGPSFHIGDTSEARAAGEAIPGITDQPDMVGTPAPTMGNPDRGALHYTTLGVLAPPPPEPPPAGMPLLMRFGPVP